MSIKQEGMESFSVETIQNQTGNNFEVLSPHDYFITLQERIPKAERRVWLKTMNFEADHIFGSLSHLMKKAAARGVDTRFSCDWFTLMVTDGQLDNFRSLNKERNKFRKFRQRNKREALIDLENGGVEVVITNPTMNKLRELNPGSGRNHIKIGIIDDTAYLGGINLSDKDFNREDFMLQIEEPSVVQALADLHTDTPTIDTKIDCTSNTSLLIDSGTKEKSIILDTACQAISDSEMSITITSQFALDRPLIECLDEAVHKGRQVVVIVSDPSKITETIPWFFDRANYWMERGVQLRIPTFEYPNWIHFKVALIDAHTPHQILIAGTHNFSGKGVGWGNEEAAIMTTDDHLITAFDLKLSDLLSRSRARSSPSVLRQIQQDIGAFQSRSISL
ncbi:MAG: phosphatidylserine/phosphatidylglycerophosphate/cardiolipin synthase family protein [Candidatus Roizmanbacteria bacterium]|nr:phosphatidylserine/phosphatidylglycerophosphate/cardiolipin synthase family protein [Candidatus Roizmanbacteria bacterium]